MTDRRHASILVGILALAAMAGAILLREAGSGGGAQSAEFQRLLGGIGLGPALDLSTCPMCFDPRVSRYCQQDFGAIPGGKLFCPHHSSSVFYYPSPSSNDE